MIDAHTHVRVARPSRDLAAAERFYVDGLGLDVLWRTSGHVPGEHDLVMVGPAGGGWHFELTRDPENPVEPSPTVDDLFVVYLGQDPDAALVRRLIECGGEQVPSNNPYWDEYGVTIADPDGYRLVLCSRTWG
ncbi:catechol 2,3-dioxygenase-like lactoylglutathione lyase family enzyme [Streptomyces sp. 3211.6]|uniref:VOC family protein n=1 Tax=Streptomyces TaxID=1883 RepID=UPI0009A515A3|nr:MULTISPECIES: VOC family protein [Streptomyces]RKT06220.1 catechol 2,3-dioxygenase-like lactoylglutathione lyase family enzyme [Streptomyces sp. 3211.6]RPF46243.1 catechol 2,3-dioxygenase-like lactoylglutathione lyase family enzyme [Streptomyces sp. Ag109_G2-6]